MDTAPKASGCFLGGTQEIFGAVSEDLLGGTGKAEDAKLPGAGIIPKPCPIKGVERRQCAKQSWNSTKTEHRKAAGRKGVEMDKGGPPNADRSFEEIKYQVSGVKFSVV